MSNTLVEILGVTTFIVIVLAGLADIILAANWTKAYFSSGWLIFAQQVTVETRHSDIPSPSLLEKRLPWFCTGVFTFKELDTNQYGFRWKSLGFRQNPIMHGIIIFDTKSNLIIIRGYLNWVLISILVVFLVIVPLIWLITGIDFNDELLVLRTLGYFVGCGLLASVPYLIDRYRVTMIIETAAELWSRKHVPSS